MSKTTDYVMKASEFSITDSEGRVKATVQFRKDGGWHISTNYYVSLNDLELIIKAVKGNTGRIDVEAWRDD